jgi:hypothetical protein
MHVLGGSGCLPSRALFSMFQASQKCVYADVNNVHKILTAAAAVVIVISF